MSARGVVGVVGIVVGAVLASACGAPAPAPCGPTSAVVREVVDGDTLTLEGGLKVRYLLVDTPESTNGKTDCYGAEARDFNRALVTGKTVTLTYGEACTDRFGRLLAYVSIDGREVNSLLLERGYGCVLFIPPAGTSRRDELLQIQSIARQSRRGLWGACETDPCK